MKAAHRTLPECIMKNPSNPEAHVFPLLRFDGEVPLGEVALLLLLLLGDHGGLVLGHAPADGAGLLCTEVEREVLLVLVEDAELCALVGVDDGEDASDRFADVVAVGGPPSVCHSQDAFRILSVFPCPYVPRWSIGCTHILLSLD